MEEGGGDFNEVLAMEEVCGAHDRRWGQIRKFRDTLSRVGLIDLGMEERAYT